MKSGNEAGREKQILFGNDRKKSKSREEPRSTEKRINKELFSPAVVPVAEGKVEIWRM